MLVEGIDAASAAFEVGYESASQFNREQALLRATADARYQSASARRLRNGQRLTTVQMILSGWSSNKKLRIGLHRFPICP